MLMLLFFSILFSFSFSIVNGAENWLVQAGVGGKQVFVPDSFDAHVGDIVTFQFVSGVHSVIVSDSFGSCVKSTHNTFSSDVYSGNPTNPPTFLGNLSSVGPIYYFCGVADACPVGKMYATINVLETGQPLTSPGLRIPKAPPAPKENNTIIATLAVLTGIFGFIILIVGLLFTIKRYKKPKDRKSEKGEQFLTPENRNYDYNNIGYDNNIIPIPDSNELSQKGTLSNPRGLNVSHHGQEIANNVNNPGQEIVNNVNNPGQEIINNVNNPTNNLTYSNPGQEITRQERQENVNIDDHRVIQQLKQELKDMRSELDILKGK